MSIDDEVWDHSVFSKNRDRLLEHAVVESFFTEVMTLADKRNLLSKEHFSVDGTLIQAWASHKSFMPKDRSNDDTNSGGPSGRNAQANWKGKPRSNDTHASTTDPDSRLFRKSHNTAAVLAYQGHVLMENRSGLVVGALVTHADGVGERVAALAMLDTLPGTHAKTLAADKAYDHATSSTLAAGHASPRTWPATTRDKVAVRSTVERRGITAMRSARRSASASKSTSAGARRSAV